MKNRNVLNAGLIRRLLKGLYQVLAALANVTTSSSQLERLRLLLFSFRRFVTTKFRCLSRHSRDSNFPEAAQESRATLTSACSGWCAQATSPLPFYNGQTTPVAAANSTQHLVASSPANSTSMPVPSIPQQATTSRTSFHAEINGPNGSRINITFIPMRASNPLRYEKRPNAEKSIEYDVLPALTRKFPNESCPWLQGATSWHSYVHPEGALYFYNKDRSTFTEANVNKDGFGLVNECVDELHRQFGEELKDNGVELVLQVSEVNASCQYYFVDHVNRTLFWLQDHHKVTEEIFSGLRGIYDLSHIAYALESEYWTHCERYPNYKLDRVKLLNELRELVMYARADIITSETSLSPLNADELTSILDLITHLKANVKDDTFPHSICVIARFMHYFSRAKFFNFCGLPCARLDADTFVYEEGTSSFLTSRLYLVLDAMLFWSPQAHCNELRRVWVDECIVAPRWADFSRNLMAEWNGITIYSTVMLAVDVSLLTVPNMNIQQSQSFGIIATYISTIFITGSLITSLLLARQTQRYGPESAEGAAQLLSKMTGTFFGMKALGTVHSLPYAMLLWGMVFFSASFLYNVFKSATVATLASVVSGCMVTTLFILWFIWAARDVHMFKRLGALIRDFIDRYSPR